MLLFAFPIMLGNLGQMFIGAGDVFVAARHGTDTVASISIATALVNTVFIIGLGLLLGISPVLSKQRGEEADINKFFKINIVYAVALSVLFGVLSWIFIPFIPYFGFEPKLVHFIQDYIFICGFSFTGAYLYQALKEFLQTYERVFFANLISIIAIFLNLFLNWIFVFGNSFVPAMGVNGLAVASLIVRTLMGLVLLFYCRKYLQTKFTVNKSYLKEIFKLGYPMALSLLLEFSAFSLVTIVAGRISTIQVAAHNIVLTLASITFMVPLSISNALGVKIGYAYGSQNYKDIKENLISGLALVLMIMSVFSSMFFIVPEVLIKCFSIDKNIVLAGSSLLFIVALFQIFDGTQITLSGVLRGLGSTKPIMLTMIIGYWVIGIPFGLYLAVVHKLEIFGLWYGLATALFACSIIFSVILKRKLKCLKADLGNLKKDKEILNLVVNNQ